MSTKSKTVLIGLFVASAILVGYVAARGVPDSRYPTTPPRRGRKDFGYKTRAPLSPERRHQREAAHQARRARLAYDE